MRGGLRHPRGAGPFHAYRFDPVSWKWKLRTTGCRVKRSAQAVANRWLEEGERIQAGGVRETDVQGNRKLGDHVAEFLALRRGEKRSGAKHQKELKQRLNRVVAETGWTQLREVTLEGLVAAIEGLSKRHAAEELARLKSSRAQKEERRRKLEARAEKKRLTEEKRRAGGAPSPPPSATAGAGSDAPVGDAAASAPGTPTGSTTKVEADPPLPSLESLAFSNGNLNSYRAAWKAFMRWAHDTGRISINPLARWHKLPTEGFQKFERRALTHEEFDRLLAATREGQIRDGLEGMDRGMLYLLAVATGFRLGELASLTPASFRLDDSPALVFLEASRSKNGVEAHQPIPKTVVDLFRGWLRGRPRGAPIWRLPESGAGMIQADLRAAGLAVVDDEGRIFDFHAVRHTLGTWLAQSGVTPQHAMKLMRHSSIDLTMRFYTHLRPAELHTSISDTVGRVRISGASVIDNATDSQAVPPTPATGAGDGVTTESATSKRTDE